MLKMCTFKSKSVLLLYHFILLTFIMPAKAGTVRSYQIYEPDIDRYYVVDENDGRDYHHAATITYFDGKWIALWNANWDSEGDPGQIIYQSESTNLSSWSTYIAAFSSSTKASNPVLTSFSGYDDAMQWQPGVIIQDNELWCMWRQNGGDPDYRGIYFSKLTSSTGKWSNERLLWNGNVTSTSGSYNVYIDGYYWNIFVSGNAIELDNGRVVFPVNIRRYDNSGNAIRRNTAMYSWDGGNSWKVSDGCSYGTDTGTNWEPTIWQTPNDNVNMVARNKDTTELEPDKSMTFSRSTNNAATWASCQINPLECADSRMHCMVDGVRNIMVANDWHEETGGSGHIWMRHNLAFFVNSGNGFDFVAGTSITEQEGIDDLVHYPQMWFKDDYAVVIYTNGNCFPNETMTIKVAKIDPLPSQNTYYIYPRYGRGEVEIIEYATNKHLVFNDDWSSCGIELDENDADKDDVTVHFRFKVYSGIQNTLLTIGCAGNAARVYADNGTIKLKAGSNQTNCGSYSDWTNIDVVTGGGRTKCRVDGGSWYQVTHNPAFNSVYLGQSFYEHGSSNSGDKFRISKNSVWTMVDYNVH